MDKCRIFSQHFFGVDKSVNYHLLDTDEMMPIKKSKRKSSIGWDMLKGKYLVHVKDDEEADCLLDNNNSSTSSLYSEIDPIYAECYNHGPTNPVVTEDSKQQNIPPKLPPKGIKKNADRRMNGFKPVQVVPKSSTENMRFKREPIKPKPTIYLGKTLEESAGTGVYFDGNGEYLVIGGKRYTAKFVFEDNAKKEKKDAATQYNRMDFLANGEEEYFV